MALNQTLRIPQLTGLRVDGGSLKEPLHMIFHVIWSRRPLIKVHPNVS